MDYTALSLADVRAGLDQIAREAETTFGALDARQLNWQPNAARWSVAQCFEHLDFAANGLSASGSADRLRNQRSSKSEKIISARFVRPRA
jgi:DinB superfamily